jgi:uncharacterized protein YijF (DUF1287 family)
MIARILQLRRRDFRSRTFVAAGVLLFAVGLSQALETPSQAVRTIARDQERLLARFVAAAVERTHHTVRYDPAYIHIPYPGGDVPDGTGVCTDEVIRTYRAIGIDLQKEVHEDMANYRSAYPRRSNRTSSATRLSTDPSIDHRRVPNLMVFFSRRGQTLPSSAEARDYQPGDLVTWNLGGEITHIGMVTRNRPRPDTI